MEKDSPLIVLMSSCESEKTTTSMRFRSVAWRRALCRVTASARRGDPMCLRATEPRILLPRAGCSIVHSKPASPDSLFHAASVKMIAVVAGREDPIVEDYVVPG
ncbi:unnamed protein product [Thlaspi arvense]|uniref:Uncharacterized protein n=1 Tax=Thlaspi arvense TaxID=13288 RepID=A0AAU9TAY6_THLAR|nr:unnamed protein product [Thlaspi arvense]